MTKFYTIDITPASSSRPLLVHLNLDHVIRVEDGWAPRDVEYDPATGITDQYGPARYVRWITIHLTGGQSYQLKGEKAVQFLDDRDLGSPTDAPDIVRDKNTD